MSAGVTQEPPQLEPHPQALHTLAQRGESPALAPFTKPQTEPHVPFAPPGSASIIPRRCFSRRTGLELRVKGSLDTTMWKSPSHILI